MFVLYRNPLDCNEIWHGGGHQGRKGSWGDSTPNTAGTRPQKGVLGASGAFGKNVVPHFQGEFITLKL